MMVKSFLVQGAGAAVASHLATLGPLSSPNEALVLFSLGADHGILLQAIRSIQQQHSISCPIYLTETYGILGFDEDLQENVELLEKGRGSEYGCRGGSGGQGCLVTAFLGCTAGHSDDFVVSSAAATGNGSAPTILMVVADQSGAWASVSKKAPLHYGGITKHCWRVVASPRDDGEGDKMLTLEQVPYFWIAAASSSVDVVSSSSPIGVCAFEDDAGKATRNLLRKMPSPYKSSGSVGLFPCFTRGVNEYGTENVETRAIEGVFNEMEAGNKPRIYGMFAHGELGPTEFADFTCTTNDVAIPCTQHSHTSILAIHTVFSKGKS